MNRNEGQLLLLSIGYFVIGICLCLLLFFFDLKGDGRFTLVNSFFGITIFLGLFSSACLYGVLKEKISFPNTSCLIVISACALIVSLGLTEFIFYRIPVSHQLTIKVSGEKNPSSLGNEVWLIGRRHDFNRVFDIDALQFSSGWRARAKDVVSAGNPADDATWSGKIHSGVAIAFLTHDFSGIVEVIWDDNKTSHDLYSSSRGYKSIALPKIQNGSAWLILKLLFGTTVLLMIWLSGIWFLVRPLDEKDIN